MRRFLHQDIDRSKTSKVNSRLVCHDRQPQVTAMLLGELVQGSKAILLKHINSVQHRLLCRTLGIAGSHDQHDSRNEASAFPHRVNSDQMKFTEKPLLGSFASYLTACSLPVWALYRRKIFVKV
jgi:hypothetical protein